MTFLLILKSLFPFLREWFLKEKALQEIVAQNKLACFLIACILVVFLIFVKVSENADKAYDDLTTANQQLGYDKTVIDDLRERVATLEGEKKQLMEHAFGKGNPPPKDVTPPPSDQVPPTLTIQPDPQKSPPKDPVKTPVPADRPRRHTPDKSLKDYVEDQLKNL